MAKVIPSSLPVIGSEMPRGQFGPAGLEERIARGLGVAYFSGRCAEAISSLLLEMNEDAWSHGRGSRNIRKALG